MDKKINYRKEARDRECQIRVPTLCNWDSATTVLAHLPNGSMGLKTDDRLGAWGCSTCHDAVDGRIRTEYTKEALNLMHHEGVIRTQRVLIREGKL